MPRRTFGCAVVALALLVAGCTSKPAEPLPAGDQTGTQQGDGMNKTRANSTAPPGNQTQPGNRTSAPGNDTGNATGNAPAPRHFEGTVALMATMIGGPGLLQANQDNCLLFTEVANLTFSGVVTATWSAATPAAATLRLVVAGNETLTADGTSPLALPFEGMRATDGGELFFAIGAGAPITVAVAQAVEIAVAFDYVGAGDVAEPTTGLGCST